MVVAGLGNEYRRDDAAGPLVASRVADLNLARNIGPIVDPLDLLGRWDGSDLAIVVDAVRSAAQPGTVHAIELAARSAGPSATTSTHGSRSATTSTHGSRSATTSTHGISLAGVLRLAQTVRSAPHTWSWSASKASTSDGGPASAPRSNLPFQLPSRRWST